MREWAEATISATSGSDVIFEGRVERQEPASIDILQLVNDPHPESAFHRTVFFAVTRVYRGSESETLKVKTGWGGGDCGFDFVTGKEYLVYADQLDDGTLEAGICSHTKSLQEAGPELRVLRGEPASSEDLLDQKVYYEQVSSKWTGTACGKVTAASGKPLKDVSLELIPVREGPFQGEGDHAIAEANGSFCFKYVDPEKFLLSAEGTDTSGIELKSFYPGVGKRSDATVLEVKADGKLTGLNFKLRAQPVHSLRFRIVNEISLPISANLHVMLVDSLNPATMEYHEENTISPDRSVTFESVPEGHYFATVFLDPNDDSTESIKQFRWKPVKEEFDVNGEMQEVVLTLVPLD